MLLRIFISLLTLLLYYQPLFASERAPLVLILGEQHLLKIEGLKRYSLGGEAVRALPLQSFKDSILLKAVRVGLADLWVWKSDGSSVHRTIQVEPLHSGKKMSELERALQKLNETEVVATGGIGTVLRGEINSLEEANHVAALKRAYPKEILDETTLSLSLLDSGKSKIRNWIKKNKKEEKITITEENGALWVRGSLQHPVERVELEREIRALFPPAILELDTLPDRAPTVYFRVFLLEIKRNHFRSLGLSWPSEQLNAFRVTRWGIQESIGLDVALQALETEGAARILSRPEIAVRAPGDAELFAGGELPIRTKTNFTNTVSWKPYGLLLKLKITHIAGANVRLEIQTEVSQLDIESGNDDIPGIKANRMKTQVDAQMGLPLLLSGLLQEDMRNQARGLPWIRKIPVLGLLFGSEDYLNARSELVAILLPMQAPPTAKTPSFVNTMGPAGPSPASTAENYSNPEKNSPNKITPRVTRKFHPKNILPLRAD